MDDDRSYVDCLPIELTLKIFRELNVEDIKNFCLVYEDYKFLLRTRELISHMDLTNTLSRSLWYYETNIDPLLVTSLNVNFCHWLSSEELRSFIGQLRNLETLSALRTQLCLCHKDLLTYNKTKINTLLLTVRGECVLPEELKIIKSQRSDKLIVPLVKKLGLEIIRYNGLYGAKYQPSVFPALESLWVDAMAVYPLRHLIQKVPCITDEIGGDKLQTLWVKSKPGMFFNGIPTSRDMRQLNVTASECSDSTTSYFVASDIISKMEPVEEWPFPENEIGWHSYNPHLVFGIRQMIELDRGNINSHNIEYDELNLCNGIDCFEVVQRIKYLSLLMSKKARNLKRLSIPSCLLYPRTSSQFISPHCRGTINFLNQKLTRNEHFAQYDWIKHADGYPHCWGESTPENLRLRQNDMDINLDIFPQLIHLRHLELYNCPFDGGNGIYDNIARCTKLEHLYIGLPTNNDGSFLIEVLKNCTGLQSLSLECSNWSESLSKNFITALRHAPKTLISIYYRCKFHIMEIIKTLPPPPRMRCLQKVANNCTSCNHCRTVYLYLQANPQLRFDARDADDLLNDAKDQVGSFDLAKDFFDKSLSY